MSADLAGNTAFSAHLVQQVLCSHSSSSALQILARMRLPQPKTQHKA